MHKPESFQENEIYRIVSAFEKKLITNLSPEDETYCSLIKGIELVTEWIFPFLSV